jgi:ubiquinone/menaquinone biosynthesis C-methylase UbiE
VDQPAPPARGGRSVNTVRRCLIQVDSFRIARQLPDGQLTLFDIQPECSLRLDVNFDRAGYRNVSFHSGDARQGLPFPDSSFDVAYLATVLGEVSDRPACIRSMARVLKPGGCSCSSSNFPTPTA